MLRRTTVFLLLGLIGAARAGEPLMKLVQTIPLEGVEGRIDHMAMDVEGKRLYVAAIGNETMEVIDLCTGKRTQSVRGLKQPTGIGVLPGSRKIVVASGGDGKVRIFNSDLKLVGTVDALDDADNVRVDPQGKLAYVGYGDGAIAVIDPEHVKKIGEIKLDGHPEAFQLETKGSRIFVNVPTSKHVAVIDRDTSAVIAKWPIQDAEANFPMAMDEANHRLFVGCRKPAKVIVLDTETGKIVASFDCCGDADDLFYDAAKKRIYVSGGEGSITVVHQDDSDHYRLLGNTPTAGGARTSFYISERHFLCLAVPHREAQRAELRIFQPLD